MSLRTFLFGMSVVYLAAAVAAALVYPDHMPWSEFPASWPSPFRD